jgi:hypothetical protein
MLFGACSSGGLVLDARHVRFVQPLSGLARCSDQPEMEAVSTRRSHADRRPARREKAEALLEIGHEVLAACLHEARSVDFGIAWLCRIVIVKLKFPPSDAPIAPRLIHEHRRRGRRSH